MVTDSGLLGNLIYWYRRLTAITPSVTESNKIDCRVCYVMLCYITLC